jgi:hypothetical protein
MATSRRAALLTASVTTQDTQSEPHDHTYQRHHEAPQPERPRKAPERKSRLTSSVFWIMKIISSPTPESDAIAPPVSRRVAVPSPGLCSTMRARPDLWLSCRAQIARSGARPSIRSTYSSLWLTMLITLPSGARTKNLRKPHVSSVSG